MNPIKQYILETVASDKNLTEKLVLKDWDNYLELVANSYEALPAYDPKVVRYWEALNKSNYTLFQRLLSKVNVVFVTNDKSMVGEISINGKTYPIEFIKQEDEYQTQSEMKKSFQDTGILKISIDYSEHPVFSVKDNIVFRTVHDYMAHILGDHDFGGKGEIASYNRHVKLAPNDAIPALFTEVLGQAAYTVTHNRFPEQKIGVLDGFDFYNLGVVDDEGYEIVDKVLVKKGEKPKPKKKPRKEPEAIFQPKD